MFFINLYSANLLHHHTYIHKTSDKWVTFVHGAGGSSSIWFRQLRAFSSEMNVLVLDLRGHGSNPPTLKDVFHSKYTFDAVTQDIVELIDHLNIKKSHFVGISLGTILIRNLAEKHPDRVESMILGGAIMRLDFRSQFLMKVGMLCKSVVPYMWLYQLFAFIIMPRKNHKKSRVLFVNEAKKLCQKEFIRWFKLTADINPLLRFFRDKEIAIPALYIMGSEDHMFLTSIKNITSQHTQSFLHVIENCGHVVNVEQPLVFNNTALRFIKEGPVLG